MFKSVLAGLLVLLSCIAGAAEIEINDSRILFIGNIEAGDYERLSGLYQQAGIQPDPEYPEGITATLFVSSRGGNVYEAMKIGRWMREKKVGVVIGPSTQCYSSCVYLLAAGLTRLTLGGEVGIHRPYFTQLNDDLAGGMRKLLSSSREYFEEMNVPSSLADEMFSTPPEKMLVLGERELSRFRLNQADMVYQERQDLLAASDYGMSRGEYLARRNAAERDSDKYCAGLGVDDGLIECVNHYRELNGLVFPRHDASKE